MNLWSYVLAGYLLTGGGILVYLLSLSRRRREVNTQRDALRQQRKDTVK